MSRVQTLLLVSLAFLIFNGQAPMTIETVSDPYVINLAPHQVSSIIVPHSYETIIINAAGGFDLFHSGDAGDSWTVEQIDPATSLWMPVPAIGDRHEGGTCQDPCVFYRAGRDPLPSGSHLSVGPGPVPGSTRYYVTPRLGKSATLREIQIVAH